MQERKQPLRFRLRSTTSPYTGEALLVQPSTNPTTSNLLQTKIGRKKTPVLFFMFILHPSFVCRKLAVPQLCVEALLRQQCIMGTLFNDVPIFHHQNAV